MIAWVYTTTLFLYITSYSKLPYLYRLMSKRNRSRNRVKQQSRPALERAGSLAVNPLNASVAPKDSTGAQYAPTLQPPAIKGGRQTQPSNVNPLGLLAYSFLPRRQWQQIDLSDLTQTYNLNAQQLIELFADLSPEVSQAVWNVLRLVNIGWKYSVTTKNGTREISRGKEILDALIQRINKDYGGIDAIIDSWSFTAFTQGAIAGEIALTDDLNDIDDIYAVQPWTVYFMRDSDQSLVPFQQQVSIAGVSQVGTQNSGFGVAGYPFRRLNPVTFGYLPVDSGPDDPYGRPPAAPVLQFIAFDLQLMKDLRQSVHMNAWGRLHIKVLEEAILKNAPASVKNDPTGVKQITFVNQVVSDLKAAYEQLKPDDAFISTDSIELDSKDFSGATINNADVLIRAIERRLIRALKQLPVLMGSNEGTTETHGTVQMVIYSKAIESIQKKIAALLQKLLGVALQVYGISGVVKWEFEPVRATDRIQDAQADMAEAQLAAFKRDQGWITQDDASIDVTGSKAVDVEPSKRGPTPLQQAQMEAQKAANNNPDNNDSKDKGGDANQEQKNANDKGSTPKQQGNSDNTGADDRDKQELDKGQATKEPGKDKGQDKAA